MPNQALSIKVAFLCETIKDHVTSQTSSKGEASPNSMKMLTFKSAHEPAESPKLRWQCT